MPFEFPQQTSYVLTVVSAGIGGLLACLAEAGKRFRFLNGSSVKLVYRASYVFIGLSILIFMFRGFLR